MEDIKKVNADRLFERILKLANIGKVGDAGTHRFALTNIDKEAQTLVTKWMEEAGMKVRNDDFGNLIGKKEGRDLDLPSIVIGSHIDTVPNGGRFDGVIGVLGGIEVVDSININEVQHDYSIEVIAFCDEEGSRFSDGLFGSRGMVGLISTDDLKAKDESGKSRFEALQDMGLNPKKIQKSVRNKEEIKCFLEMHIEQGPYLEEQNKPIGIVEGIAGPSWLKIRIEGIAGHAGTVPMNLRRDPMVGASEAVVEIERICKSDLTGSLVGTVGKIKAFPNGKNVIPNAVEFILDIRDIDLKRKNDSIQQIEDRIQYICKKRKLNASVEKLQEVEPVKCSTKIVNTLQESNEELNFDAPLMLSGAGHDSMYMSQITDVGMIFVRSKDGISHNPKEWSSKEDIEKGVLVLLKTVHKLADS